MWGSIVDNRVVHHARREQTVWRLGSNFALHGQARTCDSESVIAVSMALLARKHWPNRSTGPPWSVLCTVVSVTGRQLTLYHTIAIPRKPGVTAG